MKLQIALVLFGFCSLVSLTGCVATAPVVTQTRSEPTVRDDVYSPSIVVSGEKTVIRDGSSIKGHAVTASIHKKTKIETYYLRYEIFYFDSTWRFYESAYLPGGDKLDRVDMQRQVGSCSGGYVRSCSFTEVLLFSLTESALQRVLDDGAVDFKIGGQRDSTLVRVYKADVEALKAEVAKQRG